MSLQLILLLVFWGTRCDCTGTGRGHMIRQATIEY